LANSRYYGLILAGGRGTRFWPRSRRTRAKQVLNFVGERSLIQQTVDRLRPVLPPERIWIVTNPGLRDEIVRQLPEVPQRQIIAEPAPRNTAPCIGLACQMLHSLDPQAILGVFPADHVIQKPARFLRLVRPAYRSAAQGSIALIGIQPRWPETGYGYVEFPKGTQAGASEPVPVARFHEKPDLRTAKRFLAAGNFYWNSGMFFWRADVLLDALRRYLPRTAGLLSSLPHFSDRHFSQRLAETFPLTENISIDYAVLEKAPNVVGLLADDIGWNDVGSWNAVYELMPRDDQANAIRSTETLAIDSSGNYIEAGSKLVALLGVNGLVVVDTPDALLIADRSCAQQVSEIVKLLEQKKRDDLL
jgi:mannose-1-phosphate guanylyltransferase